MPTFAFFRQGQKIDAFSGADPKVLEERVRKWASTSVAKEEDSNGILKGQMDVNALVNFQECECLNVANDNELERLLKKDSNVKLT